MKVKRILLTAISACAWAAGAAGAAADPLPPGWLADGPDLVWSSKQPLRMGGARYEFRAGERLLGYPVQDGNRLRLRQPRTEALHDLSVWAAGRRVDAPMAASRVAPAALHVEPALAVSAVDPAAPGPFATRRLRYRLPDLVVPEFPEPVEVLAEVTEPVGPTGVMPLVLILHGRHSTCYRGGADGRASGDWPCLPGWRPVPSHTGYRYMADRLASQGYLVVSIAANGINGQDGIFADGGAFARSQLVRHHLAQWAEWSAHGGDPWASRFQARVGLARVVLIGHSRGGEGVERAAIDSEADDPWQVRGLVLIGPTAFGRQAAPGIQTAVILPFCDGDVSDLQGQQYVDIGRDLTIDRALRTSVMAMGTNHNYYNTEWTPGLSQSPAWDDWFDAGDWQCGEGGSERLTPEEQQAVGLAYTAALVDLAVGDAPQSMPLLDGTRTKPASIGRANAIVHALGGNKRLLYAAGRGTTVLAAGLTARECRGYFVAGPFDLRPGCSTDNYFELTPHWLPMSFAETAPAPRALKVEWQEPGGSVEIPVALRAGRADTLDLRIAGEPGDPPVEFDVRVRTVSGDRVTLGARPRLLRAYQGPSPLGKIVARQVRVSLAAAGVALRDVAAVELVPRTPEGRIWLFDISARDVNLATGGANPLPRVSVVDAVAVEGDAGDVTVDLPVVIDGVVTRPARLWVQLTDYANFEQPTRGFRLEIPPGSTSATIPYTYTADETYNPYEQRIQVTLLAEKDAVTGDYDGTLLVEEDDPPPVLTVENADVEATEGGVLTWEFRLSEPFADGAFWSIEFQPAAGRFPELDSDDVPASYLRDQGFEPPDPAVPLSELGIWLSLQFAPGATEASVSLPIAADGIAEPEEGAVLLLDGFGDPVVPEPIELTGTVPP